MTFEIIFFSLIIGLCSFWFCNIFCPKWCACIVAIICALPFEFFPTFYLRGVIGGFSMLAFVLVLWLNNWLFLSTPEKIFLQKVQYILLPLGIIFYFLSLGFGAYDPYFWGFKQSLILGFQPLVLVLVICGIIAAIKKMFSISVFLLGCIFAWYFSLLDSENLWDYLFDALSFICVLVVWVGRLCKREKNN